MSRNVLQLGLSIAAFACELACGSYWGGEFDGYARAERLPNGTYVIHRQDMPRELSTTHATVSVDATPKAQLMRTGDYVLLRKRPGEPWTVEARE